MTSISAKSPKIRSTATAATLFYLLIALEFLYMASPFAAYLYAASGPVFGFMQAHPALAWLNRFFLPHVVAQTDSAFINMHELIGAILFLTGLLAFLVGAFQVYFHKLTKRGAVLGGIYQRIRHPQYTALAISGLGLLLLWPRYIALVLYVVMLFIYRALARLEERECLARFGAPYQAYMQRTGRFFPFQLPRLARFGPSTKGWRKSALTGIFLIIGVGIACAAARGIERYAIDALFVHQTPNAMYLSVVELSDPPLERIVSAVEADPRVGTELAAHTAEGDDQLINYVLPASWYISEIPMAPPNGKITNHMMQKEWTGGPLRVVFTRATQLRPGGDVHDVFTRDLMLQPLLEAVYDPAANSIVSINNPATKHNYKGIPVPVY